MGNKSPVSATSGKGEEFDIEAYDTSILDELFGMLENSNGGEAIEPILCGYFNKIIQALLGKIKTKMLHYILLKRKGDIFNLLLNCLQHHSLA